MLNELINRITIYTPRMGRNRIGKEKIIQSTTSLRARYSNPFFTNWSVHHLLRIGRVIPA